MKKLIWTSIIDATLNRISSFFASLVLKRMASHAAASDAMDIAAIEERIEKFQNEGRPAAAKRLAAYLDQLEDEDPTQAATNGFAKRLLADDLDANLGHLPAPETESPPTPRSGRRGAKQSTASAEK